jgi:hypothetical protein
MTSKQFYELPLIQMAVLNMQNYVDYTNKFNIKILENRLNEILKVHYKFIKDNRNENNKKT